VNQAAVEPASRKDAPPVAVAEHRGAAARAEQEQGAP
jgi:hypothetical protein